MPTASNVSSDASELSNLESALTTDIAKVLQLRSPREGANDLATVKADEQGVLSLTAGEQRHEYLR